MLVSMSVAAHRLICGCGLLWVLLDTGGLKEEGEEEKEREGEGGGCIELPPCRTEGVNC